jgi:hypothetical protein
VIGRIWWDHWLVWKARQQGTIDDATHILRERGEAANPGRLWASYWRYLRPKCIPFWFAILDATRPVRKLFGLRQAVLDAALRKNRR